MMHKLRQWLHARPILYERLRVAFMYFVRLRYGLRQVHPTFLIMGKPVAIFPDLVAGAYGFMNDGCYVCPKVRMGKYVMLGPGVVIIGGDHRFDLPGIPMYFSGRPELKQTVVEDDVWIGCRAVVMAGVRIGRGSIVAAGAVVTADVEPYSIVAGVPARLVRKRFLSDADIAAHDAMLGRPSVAGYYPPPQDLQNR